MSENLSVRMAPLTRSFNGPSLYVEDVPGHDCRGEFLSALTRLATLTDDVERREKMHVGAQHMAASSYGQVMREEKPFAQVGSAAIIPVSGLLLNRFGGSYGWVTGYNAIRSQLFAALADPSVMQIVMDVNSPGGMAAGCFELAEDIRAAREQKPILAIVDGMACSAAYALASQATRLVAAPSASIGSIGVVVMHVSFASMLEKEGVEVTFIHAGDRKVDGNPYQPLSKEARASYQAAVDSYYSLFVSNVAAGRKGKMDEKAIRDTEARVYMAGDALALGLVDAVTTPQAAFAAFVQGGGGQEQQEKVTDMTDKTKAEGAGTETVDANAVKKAERARIAAITGHAEAEGRTKLATHLALNTEMSVEEAGAILAASPKETVSAPKAKETDALADAMGKIEQPGIGPEAGKGDGKTDPVASMLGAWAAATGTKIEKEKAH